MGVSVKKLYESVKSSEISLLAGIQGLTRLARWVHMVENEEISKFLKGGEIVFITGVALEKGEDLLSLVKSVVSCGASAIVLNLGPYIKEISSEIIEFCDERQIPLFCVPWSVYMAEIMRKFCLMITLDDKKEVEISSAIRNAILFPSQEELYVPHLESYGLIKNSSYLVLLLEIKNNDSEKIDISKKMIIRQIENYSSQSNWQSLVIDLEEYILILFNNKYTEKIVLECCYNLKKNCTSLSMCSKVFFGIGQKTKNLQGISKSFLQAKSVIELQKNNLISKESVLYRDLGIYKLLFSIKDKEFIKSYVDETIGKILKYDELNDANLENVLVTYLKNNGSVKETADELFIHRNTVNYKIHKIGEILNLSISNNEVCSELLIALKLHNILNMDL